MDLIYAATSIQPDRSFVFTITVIIAGLGIVLATLALLIVIFQAFGKGLYLIQEKKKNKNVNKEDNAPPQRLNEVPPPPPIIEPQGIPDEVVAAIGAAVYMLEGEGAKITSISRVKPNKATRSAWAQAAVIDNTKPF